MDRYCKGCNYQYYRNDMSNWAFCICENIPRGKEVKAPKQKLVYSDDYPSLALSEMSKNDIPSCMLVQSFYEGSCPWYKKSKLEKVW